MLSFKRHLEEKLKASDDMGDWVKDFQDSDAPQFKGKSQKKRQQMAVAAKLGAERNEEVELDEVSDKKLDAYRQKAFADQPAGDDGSDKYRKRKFGRDLAFSKQTGRAKVLATKESVEELDELKKSTLGSYIKRAAGERGHAGIEAGASASGSKDQKDAMSTMKKRLKGIKMASDRLAKESVEELDELKKSTLGSYVNRAADDISHIQRDITSSGTQSPDYKNLSRMRRNRKGGIATAVKKLTREEVEELDELSPNTLSSYASKANIDASKARSHMRVSAGGKDFATHKKRYDKRTAGAVRAGEKYRKLVAREEVELDEGKNLTDTKSDWRSDKSATAKNWSHNKLMKVAKHDRSAEKEIKRRIASKEYVFANEEVELDEASNLRITKIYNPKKATYAVHSPDRKYFKEFDNEVDAKKHLETKKEEVDLDQETQYEIVESYLLENNIDVNSLTEEELNELIGKAIGGAFKLGAKAVVGAGRLARKAVVNKQGNVRGTQAAKNDAMKAKLDKLRKQRTIEVQRQKLKKDVERAQAKLTATKSRA